MKKIKLLGLALLLVSNLTHATVTPCDGFEIRIKNKLPDDFVIDKVELKGADLQPGIFQVLKANAEQVFTVSNSNKNEKMTGEFILHSISLPVKKVRLSFDLQNKVLICHHHDKGSNGDYPVQKTRLPNKVSYEIG